MSQNSLFTVSGGPVAIIPRSHKKGAPPVASTCREILPDGSRCPKPRRLVQGARYCEDHARGIDYVLQVANVGVETATCSCGQEFKRKRQIREGSRAWFEFCPDCHARTALTLSQLRHHKVPYETAMRWLALGDQLCCERPGCGRRFTPGGKGCAPHIDHDHNCCHGAGSCGECVRGVLCQPCNFAVGQFEYVLRSTSADEIERYIKNRCK